MVSGAVPKVVIIVGPAGVAETDRYRAEAKSAAALARKYAPGRRRALLPRRDLARRHRSTPETRPYVVYMGHGNGWPSRYRDAALFRSPRTASGLNPVAGGGDDSHQYFGEASVAREVKLAKNAGRPPQSPVLRQRQFRARPSRGDAQDQAERRVRQTTRQASSAPARSAVVAEAWASPNERGPSGPRREPVGRGGVARRPERPRQPARLQERAERPGFTAGDADRDRDLRVSDARSGTDRQERPWLARQVLASAPTGASERRPARRADRADRALPRWHRARRSAAPNILEPADRRQGGRSADVPYKLKSRREAADRPPGQRSAGLDTKPSLQPRRPPPTPPRQPTQPRATRPATSNQPAPPGAGVARSRTRPLIAAAPPVLAGRRRDRGDRGRQSLLTRPRRDGQRDDRYEDGHERDGGRRLRSPPQAPRRRSRRRRRRRSRPTTTSRKPQTRKRRPPRRRRRRRRRRHATSRPSMPPLAASRPRPGREPRRRRRSRPGKFGRKNLTIPVTPPAAPGRYRLTVTLHDSDGVAYDAATQAMLPGLMVRVTGQFDGAVLADPTASLTAGASVALPVRVANLGTVSWGMPAARGPISSRRFAAGPSGPGDRAVGAALRRRGRGHPATPERRGSRRPADRARARSHRRCVRQPDRPDRPGEYLLLLDVVTPAARFARRVRLAARSGPRHGHRRPVGPTIGPPHRR